MKRTFVDCDPGIDDAVALLLALASPELDIVGIGCVSGNLTADRCAANALRILDLARAADVPVSAGPLKPLVRPYPRDPFSHGADGLAELGLPNSGRSLDPRFAADLLLDASQDGPLTLIALGPLTNVALAVIKDPSLPGRVERLICIGGAFGFHATGSTRATGDNPTSEWNFYVDPEAANIVLDAGFDLTAIGLDVATHPDVELSAAHRARLSEAGTPQADFLLGVTDFVERRGFRSYCGLIDAIAVACAIDPDLLETERIGCRVATEGALTRGQSVVDRRDHFRRDDLPLIKAASIIASHAFLDLLVGRLSRAPEIAAHG